MIVKWKAVTLDLFQTEWRGMTLSLHRTSRGLWKLKVDASEGVLEATGTQQLVTKDKWATSKQAIEAVDAEMTRIIMSTKVVAQQRPGSRERLVRNG